MPRLDGQPAAYLAQQLDAYAMGSRRNPVMSPIAASLTVEERAAVAAWYAALPGPPAPQVPPLGPNERGRQLALDGDPTLGVRACIACHGTLGVGIPPAFPYLVGQDPAYMALQFTFWRQGLRGNEPLGVMRQIAERLPAGDVAAVADWFASLPAAAPLSPSAAATLP
jgi:cytochrome c553